MYIFPYVYSYVTMQGSVLRLLSLYRFTFLVQQSKASLRKYAEYGFHYRAQGANVGGALVRFHGGMCNRHLLEIRVGYLTEV